MGAVEKGDCVVFSLSRNFRADLTSVDKLGLAMSKSSLARMGDLEGGSGVCVCEVVSFSNFCPGFGCNEAIGDDVVTFFPR